MGLTQKLGTIPLAILTDASNNVGIGGSPSGSYKLEVTGTGRFSGAATFSSTLTTTGIGINYTGALAAKLHITVAPSTSYAPAIALRDFDNPTFGFTFKLDTAVNGDMRIDRVNAGVDAAVMSFQRSTGNVGIGTSSPIAPLSIPSSVTNSQITTGSLEIQSFGTNNSWIADNLYYNNGFKARVTGYTSQIYFDTGGNIGFFTNNGVTTAGATSSLGQRMLITSAGSVGINGTPPSTVKLGVFGASATSSDYAFACYTNAGGNLIYVRNDGFLYSVSAWSGSDRRLKENITDLDNGLEKVLGLKARKYDLIDSFKNQFGFIAQEVQEVIPDAVSVFQEETQMLAIKMDFIVPHLVKAVQELSAQNQDLKSRLDKAGL